LNAGKSLTTEEELNLAAIAACVHCKEERRSRTFISNDG